MARSGLVLAACLVGVIGAAGVALAEVGDSWSGTGTQSHGTQTSNGQLNLSSGTFTFTHHNDTRSAPLLHRHRERQGLRRAG